MDECKRSCPLESIAASPNLPICHHCVHRPLLADFCLWSTTALGPGCVKTFLRAATARNESEISASVQFLYSLTAENLADFT